MLFSSSRSKKIVFLAIILFLLITLNLITYFTTEYYKDISYPTYGISSESRQIDAVYEDTFPFNNGFLMTNNSDDIHQVEYYDENLLLQSKRNLSGWVLTTSNKFILTTKGFEYQDFFNNTFVGIGLNNSYTLNVYNNNLQNEFNITVDREYKKEISLNFPFYRSSIVWDQCKIVGNNLIIPEFSSYIRNKSKTTFEDGYQDINQFIEIELVVINLSTRSTNIYSLGIIEQTPARIGSSQLFLHSSSKFEYISMRGLLNSSIAVQSFTLDIKTKEVKESKRVFNNSLKEEVGFSYRIIGMRVLANDGVLTIRERISYPNAKISDFENQTIYFTVGSSFVKWDSQSTIYLHHDLLSINNNRLLVAGNLRTFDENPDKRTYQSWMFIVYYYDNKLLINKFPLHRDEWISSSLQEIFAISRNKFGVLIITKNLGSDNFASTVIIYDITPSNFNALLRELPSYMIFIIPTLIALLPSPLIYRRIMKRKSVQEDYPVHRV